MIVTRVTPFRHFPASRIPTIAGAADKQNNTSQGIRNPELGQTLA
jgi:hypothetical protein